MSAGKVYSMPVNLHTINQFFNKSLTPQEATLFLENLADKSITEPNNFEEQALKFIGRELYEAFFYGYTKKQWGCEPSELPASVLKRIPVRFNYDDNYHNYLYTGIPVNGYTELFEKLIDNSRIQLTLNKKFISLDSYPGYDHVFYTGPVDAYFNHKYGKLGYRTVTFKSFVEDGDHQGTAQMNYCDEKVPYTRVTEHKHFAPWEKHDKTIYFIEYSKETTDTDIPYYPKRLETDKELVSLYRDEAENLDGVSFLGRLATYRYMDMHNVIAEAINFASLFVDAKQHNVKPPVFPNIEVI
jgi:UDP-galactopyranose mutase